MNTTTEEKISIIIPAYNEANRIGRTLRSIVSFFDKQGLDYEVIVIMDGCTDGTDKMVLQMAESCNRIVPLIYPSRLGKGGALIRGFWQAKGDYLIMLDADGPTPPEDLYRLVLKMRDYDLVVGSRYIRDSRVLVREPLFRIVLSRVFNLLVKLMFPRLRNFRDTQCGVKVLRKEVLKRIGKDLFITDLAFDVNLIYSTVRNNFKVKEVGITWRHSEEGSKVKGVLKVSVKMLLSLIRLRIYYSRFKSILESKPIQWISKLIYTGI